MTTSRPSQSVLFSSDSLATGTFEDNLDMDFKLLSEYLFDDETNAQTKKEQIKPQKLKKSESYQSVGSMNEQYNCTHNSYEFEHDNDLDGDFDEDLGADDITKGKIRKRVDQRRERYVLSHFFLSFYICNDFFPPSLLTRLEIVF